MSTFPMNSTELLSSLIPVQLDSRWLHGSVYNITTYPVDQYISDYLVDYYLFRFALDIAQDRAEWTHIQQLNGNYYAGDNYYEELHQLLLEHLSEIDELKEDVESKLFKIHSDIFTWFVDRIDVLSDYLQNILFPPVGGIRRYLRQLSDFGEEGTYRFVVHEINRATGVLLLTTV